MVREEGAGGIRSNLSECVAKRGLKFMEPQRSL